MFEKLLKQWANEQGFDGWSQDHAAVLRNLSKWLNMHAVEQPLAPDGLKSWGNLGKCTICGKAWKACSCLTSRR